MSDLAVVFETTHRRGGVERVAWDLMAHVARGHSTTFVGFRADEGLPERVTFRQVPPWHGVRSLGPAAFRHRAARTVAALRPKHIVGFGATAPTSEIIWVGSVHRAWLEAARTVRAGRVEIPAQLRFVMPRHRVLLALERIQFRECSARLVICTSTREVDDLERFYGLDPSRTAVLPNPFDPDLFSIERRKTHREEARAALGVRPGQLAVLFVANELHRKGFGQTLQAMAAAKNDRLSLHLLGRAAPGPYQHLIDRLGLRDRVRYHGPTGDVGWWMAGGDALVLPTQYEPFGLVIVEALASGLPVLTTQVAGAAEAVQHGRTGWLMQDAYDVEELAGLLVELSQADLPSMGAHAAGSVSSYRREAVMARAEALIFDT